jgi:DNA adenine methylase
MLTSPLRYPGGKAKLFPFFAALIEANGLFGSEYCEPYAGGAGLALQLLETGFVDSIRINDIDPGIFAFWSSVLECTDEFCDLLNRTPITIAEWHNQHSIWAAKDGRDPLALGFATYFLNRTNRSGIIEGAGPIGGYDQTGKWKIDARLIKARQVENILRLSRCASRITVSNQDAIHFVSATAREPNTLLYLDPPYYVKGRKLYTNFYVHEDHERIAELLRSLRSSRWLVSYDDAPAIREMYRDFEPISYTLQYSAGKAGAGAEVMYLSDSLALPDAKSGAAESAA